MREEMLFSWQGGPIILLQVRREYGIWSLGLCALVDFIFHNLDDIHSPPGLSGIGSRNYNSL